MNSRLAIRVSVVAALAAFGSAALGQTDPASQPANPPASQPAIEAASQPAGETPERPASQPANPPAAEPPASQPASQPASGPAVVETTAPAPAKPPSVVDVAPLDAETLKVFELEVERLRRTADGLSSGGEHGAAIVAAAEGRAEDLDLLGLDASHVGELRGLMNEVAMLRARRHLLNVQSATSIEDSASPLDKVEKALTPPVVEHTPIASAPAPAPKRLAKVPTKDVAREAELLFRAGQHQEVVRLLSGEALQSMSSRTSYILGAALVAAKRRDEAKAAFERAATDASAPVIADAARRQIELLEHVHEGVVGPDPLSERDEAASSPAKKNPSEEGHR